MRPANERRRYIVTSSLIGGHIHKMIPGRQHDHLSISAQRQALPVSKTLNARRTLICLNYWTDVNYAPSTHGRWQSLLILIVKSGGWWRLLVEWFIQGWRTVQEMLQALNTLRPRQHGRHFADDILKRIFLNENVWIPIEISLKFVPKGLIDNIPALV